uniref:Serine/arginine-rich splicing factor 3 n=2 Tax=Paramormyrops kingsleyae TaxID=1676925 RepID=A0A3B3R7F9_9TELE
MQLSVTPAQFLILHLLGAFRAWPFVAVCYSRRFTDAPFVGQSEFTPADSRVQCIMCGNWGLHGDLNRPFSSQFLVPLWSLSFCLEDFRPVDMGDPTMHRDCPLDCKVYVGNLGNNGNKTELERAFGYYGPLRSVWVARNPPGFAFVEFEDPRDATDAVRELDGRTLCGCRVRVEMSNGEKRSRNRGPPPSWSRRPRDDYRRRSPPPRRRSPRRRSFSRSRSRSLSRDRRRDRSFSRDRNHKASRSFSRSRSRSRSNDRR